MVSTIDSQFNNKLKNLQFQLESDLNEDVQYMRTDEGAFKFYIETLKKFGGYGNVKFDSLINYLNTNFNNYTNFNNQLNTLVKVFKRIINYSLGIKDLNKNIDRDTEKAFLSRKNKNYWLIRKSSKPGKYLLTIYICDGNCNLTYNLLKVDDHNNVYAAYSDSIFKMDKPTPILDMIYKTVKKGEKGLTPEWGDNALDNIYSDIKKYLDYVNKLNREDQQEGFSQFQDSAPMRARTNAFYGDEEFEDILGSVGGKRKTNRRKSHRRKSIKRKSIKRKSHRRKGKKTLRK